MIGLLLLSGCGSADPASAPSESAAGPATTSPTASPTSPSASAVPSPTATPEPAAKTYTTSDGVFAFDYPAEWSVVDGPAPAVGPGQAVSVLDAAGRTMATLSTGYPAIRDAAMMSPSQPRELDYQELPSAQLPLLFPDSVNAFNYQLVFNPNTNVTGAVMSINNLRIGADHGWLRGLDMDMATGASFSRWIDGAENLAGVDPTLQAAGGLPAFEEYMTTPEYADVKNMLMSLRKAEG